MTRQALVVVLVVSGLAACLCSPTTSQVQDCGNGKGCSRFQTCATPRHGSGLKWACAPTQHAVVCADARFSCPLNFTCVRGGLSCARGGLELDALENAPATRLSRVQEPLDSFCALINPDLPSFCNCTDQTLGAKVECDAQLPDDLDTVGVVLDISPCTDPAHIDLDLHETRFNITYKVAGLDAGFNDIIPIPGVSFSIPKIGSAGLDVVVGISGNADALDLRVGLDVCGKVLDKQLCADEFIHSLPLWLIDGHYSFGNVCNSTGVVRREQVVQA